MTRLFIQTQVLIIRASLIVSLKKRGGQPGHDGHEMKFYNWSAEDIKIEHRPTIFSTCGEPLTSSDAEPFRHRILELPQIS